MDAIGGNVIEVEEFATEENRRELLLFGEVETGFFRGASSCCVC